ncbi:integrin alpha-5-like isoform X2 [Montipora capricornis]|uniref:integrin alpha-5-like isoform X2 n=1 Tax=Montipora capricornis TaxID=246305 RepID=UPI0035F11377
MLLTSTITCLLLSFSLGTYGFNLDVKMASILSPPPASQSEYFGYSVALHSYRNRYWAIVGAPLSNVTSSSGRETFSRYGAVYSCEYSGLVVTCKYIPIDNTPVAIEGGDYAEEKEKQWLGGVVYSTGKDGKAMACAPRYSMLEPYSPPTGKIVLRWLIGRCFLLSDDLERVSQNGIVNPCEKEVKGNAFYGYCQAGFSAVYMKDPPQDIVLGAVGSKQWTGAAMMVNPEFLNAYAEITPQDQVDLFNYNGYSVDTGKFSVLSRPDVISGAPRADSVKGKVLIYDIFRNRLTVRSQLPQPKDLHIGSYFGSVVCAVDLDNNQYADVLVGAPYYTNVKDEGRVYIYLNNGQGVLDLLDTVLEGDKKYNSRFGQAITSVGDLNADGFQDVAIGAPMEGEDGSGAVYIYHGSSKGIELPYSQKIEGSGFQSGLKMFGISIAGGVDIDQNGYPDIVVGAYASEKAVIIRSRSVVNVVPKVRLSEEQITVEGNDGRCLLKGLYFKCLNVTVKLKYEDVIQTTRSSDLNISYTLELEKDKDFKLRRMFFWDNVAQKRFFLLDKNVTLASPKIEYLVAQKTVYIRNKTEIGDLSSLLTFDLALSQPQPPCSDLCPVLNDYMAKSFRVTIPFAKKCRNQVTCVPDLAVTQNVAFDPVSDVLSLGVAKDFTLQLTVENKAEDSAYTSKLTVKFPDALNYIGPDQGVKCDRSDSANGTEIATCDVGNPLVGKAKKTFGIKFTPGTVKKDFVIEIEASSQDRDANDNDNKQKVSVGVKFEADVEITGSSKQDQVVYQGPVRSEEEVRRNLESIGPEIVQTVSVLNKGPSDVASSEVVISFPRWYSSSKLDRHLLYLVLVELEGASGICNATVNPLKIQPGNDTSGKNVPSRKRRDTENIVLSCRKAACQSFKCQLGRLKTGDKANIKLTFRLWENTLLQELVNPRAVDLETTATVKVPDEITQSNEANDIVKIITTVSPASTAPLEKKTPWWIILLSVLGGLLLVAVVIVVLYKLGFFKRKQIKDISGPDTTEMSVK